MMNRSATVACAHAGNATPTTSFFRVMVAGEPVVTVTTGYVVVGCALVEGPLPPCVAGQWLSGAARVLAGGTPVAVRSSSSTTAPSGTPMLALDVQMRVLAS